MSVEGQGKDPILGPADLATCSRINVQIPVSPIESIIWTAELLLIRRYYYLGGLEHDEIIASVGVDGTRDFCASNHGTNTVTGFFDDDGALLRKAEQSR